MTADAPSATLHRAEVVRTSAGLFDAVAAGVIASTIRREPTLVLGIATGQTPEGVYLELVKERELGLRTDRLSLVALDEYVGLDPRHPQSYAHYVATRVATPLGVAPDRVHVPAGHADDLADAADAYERTIASLGGVGLQIVGIGSNGHLAFNEPGSPADSRTRVVELDESTRTDNARFFDGDLERVPARAITQGLGTILKARRIVMLARGARKAEALAAALGGPVTERNPASLLQRHPDVVVVADLEASRDV